MKKNMGTIDRTIRFLLALTVVILYFTGAISGVAAAILGVFALIFVLTGGGPADSTEVLSTYTYKILFSTSNFGYGSALATSMFLSVAFITFLFLLLLRGENKLR